MKAHIFTDDGKQWKLIPKLPIKPTDKEDVYYKHDLDNYEIFLHEAKANALPIVNPELFLSRYKGITESNKLYEWPGTWEKVRYSIEEDSTAVGVAAKLIAPQQPQAEKLTPNDAGYKYFTCPTCDGSGKISQDQQTAMTQSDAPNEGREDNDFNDMWCKACFNVAKKYGLGTHLVTGHKAAYWEEAAKLASQSLRDQLKKVSWELLDSVEQHQKEREMRKELVKGAKSLLQMLQPFENMEAMRPLESFRMREIEQLIAKASELDKT